IANEVNKSEETNNNPRRRRRPRGWFPRCCVYEAFRMEDLWSGKLEPDSEVVQAQFVNFGPEGYDENDEENNNVQPEESVSDDTTSASTSASTVSSTSSKKLRKRKIRQED